MIVIADYGMGNLHSVTKGFERVGAKVLVSSDPLDMDRASHVVLPGVGAFDDAAVMLRETGMDQAVLKAVREGKPVLGICLGMQLLFRRSDEGKQLGLGIFDADILRFPETDKVPHMGWNIVRPEENCSLYAGMPEFYAYFVHSFYAPYDKGYAASFTEYSVPFASSVQAGNLFATQYHPEKSGEMGLCVLKNFANLKG